MSQQVVQFKEETHAKTWAQVIRCNEILGYFKKGDRQAASLAEMMGGYLDALKDELSERMDTMEIDAALDAAAKESKSNRLMPEACWKCLLSVH